MRPMVLVWSCLALLAAGPAVADDAPLSVTTDTEEYCALLARRLAGYDDAPAQARLLSSQGWHLCETGRVLPGIARLRRAMTMLRGNTPVR